MAFPALFSVVKTHTPLGVFTVDVSLQELRARCHSCVRGCPALICIWTETFVCDYALRSWTDEPFFRVH
jgi:hypothetical protein